MATTTAVKKPKAMTKKNLDHFEKRLMEERKRVLKIIRESIEFGLSHRDEAVRHSMPYARDLNETLAAKFIGMYVNDYTRDYGETGRTAIRKFLGRAHEEGYLDRTPQIEFVE